LSLLNDPQDPNSSQISILIEEPIISARSKNSKNKVKNSNIFMCVCN